MTPTPLAAGSSSPALFAGRYEIKSSDEGDHVARTLTTARRQNAEGDAKVFVAEVVIASGMTWRGCPPGSRSLLVTCGGCGDGALDVLPLDYDRFGNGARWRLTATDPVNVEPSIVTTFGGGTNAQGQPAPLLQRCHYFVHRGRFELLADSLPWNTTGN